MLICPYVFAPKTFISASCMFLHIVHVCMVFVDYVSTEVFYVSLPLMFVDVSPVFVCFVNVSHV